MAQRSKTALSLGLAASLMASAAMVGNAEARGGGIAAGIIGGVVAGAILGGVVSQSRRPAREPRVVRERAPRQNPARIVEANKVLQSALASLGHYNGPIDGKSSKPTKDAIIAYQKSLGDKPTGSLTKKQREILMASYAQNSANAQNQQAQNNAPAPDNTLHKLLAGGAAAGAAGFGATQVVAGGAAPVFLASACSQTGGTNVTLAGGAVGGLLPDQYCRARNVAIADASKLITPVMAQDFERMRGECKSATEQMAAYSGAATTEPVATLSARLIKDFQPLKAQNAVESAVTAYKICLGVGYQEDRADMVLASGLGLVGLGHGGHGEVVAAVLSQGANAAQLTKQAGDWLDYAAGAIEKGAPSLDPTLGADRATILRLASRQMKAGGQNAAMPQGSIQLSSTLQAPRVPVPMAPAPQVQVPTPAPAIAAAPTGNIHDRMKNDAIAFFETEKSNSRTALPQQLSALKLSEAELERKCASFADPADIASGKPVAPADIVYVQACRSWAYSKARVGFMVAFDQRLADSGDKDASSRLTLHRLAGH